MDALPLPAGVLDMPADERAMLSDTELVEFRCARCSYGISLTGSLPSCPMCQSHLWVLVDRDAT
jgi:Zn finger protein HypA/HybF involved in hydrogenase expression